MVQGAAASLRAFFSAAALRPALAAASSFLARAETRDPLEAEDGLPVRPDPPLTGPILGLPPPVAAFGMRMADDVDEDATDNPAGVLRAMDEEPALDAALDAAELAGALRTANWVVGREEFVRSLGFRLQGLGWNAGQEVITGEVKRVRGEDNEIKYYQEERQKEPPKSCQKRGGGGGSIRSSRGQEGAEVRRSVEWKYNFGLIEDLEFRVFG